MNIFEHLSYKSYMKKLLGTSGERRGARSRLAKYLTCQTGYISQVLSGETHFSLEHSIKINSFLEHDEEENHFFMLLVHYGRAGSSDLKKYYKQQINKILKERSEIKSRINEDATLSNEDHMEYYSQWYYSAIHVLVSIKGFQTKAKIKERLKIDNQSLNKVLSFLEKKNLIINKKGAYLIGPSRIHLSKDSPIISKHHTNWRIEALKSLEKDSIESNLHYSCVMTLSKEDALKVKSILLNSIETVEPVLIASPEEEIYSMCLDFFEV
ncbi:hypothetical protein A9Q84_10185 [Halobacteriovorax marinus]|uniref:DUF4423 domain-containing protein n=1 Tax=Halobacteriovorax marinus TaxID=97084 RepID=A0A1Y5FDN7_9BACT|nr:hypothetical protein A9Q84_10185 [Halobacteriovorax marinus]